ncbi:MAG TPA: D-glycero-beta-D-manno-heptose-7-phosphate kinase [Pyrinomonadaceae bacterium]|nr:D-glycero-beta-D-manno-heptose-7-phosphate kinase [Pyrinomonadaceae bacterium]
MSKLLSIINNFPKVKVLIVGDVMLDRYWWGSVRRISPEAPVPVVNLQKTSLAAGGAANVAANVAGLGAEPILVGAIGEDEEAALFSRVLEEANVSGENLVRLKNRSTTIKTRIVAHSQHVVRIDQEHAQNLDFEEENLVWNKIEEVFEKVSVIVLSDYAKGILTENLISRLISKGKENKKLILVDPKGKNYKKYRGATILTPNKKEAAQASGLEENGQDLVEKAGKLLLEENELEALLITQGEEGMTLFQKNQNPLHLTALARKVYDVTGAGDTVIAGLGVAAGAEASLAEAAEIANIAAGLVVEEIGTTVINAKKLKSAIEENQ